MNNKRATKRALLTSVMALVMCVVMLVGTTFAWFTDTASTGVNKIQAGNLDVKMSYLTKENGWQEVTETTKLFDDNALWEPGHTEVAYLMVENVGNLALKYQLSVNVANEVTGTSVLNNTIKLSDYIKMGVVDNQSTAFADRNAARAAVQDAGNIATYTKNGNIAANGAAQYVAMVVYMPETVGNEANYVGNTAPSIELGVKLYATQDTVENDSFDNQYDKDAPYETVKVSNEKELRTALFNAPTDGSGVKIVLQDDITLDLLYAAPNLPSSDVIQDYEAGDTLNRYKKGVHPTAEDPNHWNTLVTNQTDEEKAAYGAYYHMGANDERIARLVVKANQDVILDLNGHNLSKAARATHGDWSDVCTSLIGNYGTLSIIDSKGTGLITGSGLESCSGGVIHNYGGALTIKGVNIDGGADYTNAKTGQYTIVNGDQSKPTLYKNGTIVLDGAHIYDGATSASLICNNAGTMTIKNETELKHKNTKVINCKGGEVFVESAKIWSDKYAVYAAGGTVTVTTSAVHISGTGTMEEAGGTIVHKS